MSNKLRLGLLATVFAGVSFANSASAASGNTISLNTVTVVATRTEENVRNVPAQVSVIETGKAGNTVITDVQDLFKDTPAVQLTGGPRSNGQDFVIRGYDTNSILKLIDGTRLNYESAHDGQFFIDPRMLKKVEVVRGASSSIYGGGAMGGVVAFETKDAADMLEAGQNKGYSLGFNYRSANQLTSPSLTLFQRTDELDIIGNFNHSNSGNIQQGDDNKLAADDSSFNGFGKVKWFADDASTFTASFIGYNGDNDREPNNGTSVVNTTDNFESKKDVSQHITSLGYEFNPDSDLVDLSVKAYHNDTDVTEMVNDGGASQGRESSRKLRTIGFNIDNISRLNVTENSGHTVSYGAEYYEDEQQSARSTGGVAPGVPNGESRSWGTYVQDEIKLNEKLTVTPAVRYDYFETEQPATAGTYRNDDEVSPKLAAVYKIDENINVFGSAARAFRAPKITELYPSGVHFPTAFHPVFGFPTAFNTFLTNPNLNPETSDNYELGYSLKYNELFKKSDEFNMKASIYRTEAEDFISQSVSVNAGANTQYLNAQEAEIHGFEIESTYDTEAYYLSAGLAYSRAEDVSTNSYLSESQPLTFVTNFGYKLDEANTVVGFRSTFADATRNVPAAERRDGYGVHDIYAEWSPENKNLQGFKVNLSVTNIFDKKYTPNFSSLFEEGRSFNAGVTYTVGLN